VRPEPAAIAYCANAADVQRCVAYARAHGVEPVAYLTECLRRHDDVAERPEHYLPWAYRERNKEAASSRAPPQSSSAARATSAPPSIASS